MGPVLPWGIVGIVLWCLGLLVASLRAKRKRPVAAPRSGRRYGVCSLTAGVVALMAVVGSWMLWCQERLPLWPMDIYALSADATEAVGRAGSPGGARNLTNTPRESEYDPAWSPDGRRIAFASGPAIHSTNPDGGGKVRLTRSSLYTHCLSWSPDGTRIAFVADRPVGGWARGVALFITAGWPMGMSAKVHPCDLHVVNRDGTGRSMLLLRDVDGGVEPAWSPDSRKILATIGRQPAQDICAINADGSGRSNLTNSPGSYGSPRWSPDGRTLAFLHAPPQAKYDIFLMSADGGARRNLTNNPAQYSNLAWSLDGHRIAFVAVERSDRGNEAIICTINADGRGLTRRGRVRAWGGQAAWSPDGWSLACASSDPKDRGIYLSSADGTGERPLARGAGWWRNPAWSPDGHRIAFARWRPSRADTYRSRYLWVRLRCGLALACGVVGPLALCLAVKSLREERARRIATGGVVCGAIATLAFVVAAVCTVLVIVLPES